MTIRELLRKPFTDTPFAKPVDLTGKKVIVTGCGPGSLGYETAKTLSRWGALVIITTRNNTHAIFEQMSAELKAEGSTPHLVEAQDLNLLETESVNQFADWYLQNHGDRLDVLINNAGVHLDLMSKWKEPNLTADGYEIQWRINYLGGVQLTHKLLPLLQKTGQEQGEVRVVNVVSQIHKSKGSNKALFDPTVPYSSWQSYGLSKLGMIHFGRELNRRYGQEYNLKAYSLHPGAAAGTTSDVANKGFEGHPIINFFRWLGSPIMNLMATTVDEGAQTQLHCAAAPDAESGYYQNCILNEEKASDDSRDQASAERLWDETQPWIDQVCS